MTGDMGPVRHRRRPLLSNAHAPWGHADTAEIYGLGKKRAWLGEALGDDRTEVVVASRSSGRAVSAVIKNRESRQCAAAAAEPYPAVSDPLAQPGGPRFGDHAGMRDLLDSGAIGAAESPTTTGAMAEDAALGRPSATRPAARPP